MTMLQVAINPLLRAAGGEEHFAFNSVAAQLVFGAASFLSPFVYSYLVTRLKDPATARSNALLALLDSRVPRELPWVSLYWVFAVVALMMVVVIALVRLPRFELKDEERAGAWATHRELLRNRTVWLYFAAIFCYVGSEQGIANWISKFLATYHGYDPQVEGARAVAMFWGLMTAGCLLGLVLLKLFDCRRVLVGFAAAAIVTLSVALFGGARGLVSRLHGPGLLPLGHVVGGVLAGAQLGCPPSRLVLGHPLHRHRRRRLRLAPGRLAGRSLRAAGWHDARSS